jgi:hypothetical protein
MRHTLSCFLMLLVISSGRWPAHGDTVLLQDNFNDNSLDPTKWTTVLPDIPGTPSVTEQNQHIEITDRGYLVTASQYDPSLVGPLTLTGTWTFDTSAFAFQQEDYMEVFTRSDAVPYGAPYGEVHNGVGFILHMQGDNPGNMWIADYEYGKGSAELAETPIVIRNGDSFHFTIQDDGLHVTFSVQQINGPASGVLTADVATHFSENHIVFYNAQRDTNPVPKLSILDDVRLTGAVPEPSSILLLGCGIAAWPVTHRRFIRRGPVRGARTGTGEWGGNEDNAQGANGDIAESR